MKKHTDIHQGSAEWHELRAKYFTASEAAAVMGDHKYMSRDELLHQKATGIIPEVSEQQQRLFDKGHASEASARFIAETVIDEALEPATVTRDEYLASMDGLTPLGDIGWEHKLFSKSLVEQIKSQDLDKHYVWQLEHQAMVSGCAEILFMTSDGTQVNCEYFMYTPNPKLQAQLISGWKQFEIDLEAYKTKLANGEIKQTVQAQAEVLLDLPAITYEMNGLALTSNFDKFKVQARELIKKSREPLVTDDDFATAESLVKVFKSAEEKLSGLSEQVIGEVSDIDAFIKELKQVSEGMRQARLATEKLVTAEKQNRRQEIINKAQHDLNNHIQAQQSKLDGYALPAYRADFEGALKGKRTIESLQSAANDCLANAKIAISQQADDGAANLKAYKEHAAGYEMLFSDLQQNLFKAHDDFVAMVKLRVTEHKQKEAEKLEAERERIRQEEADKAALAANRPEPQHDPEPEELPLAAEKPALKQQVNAVMDNKQAEPVRGSGAQFRPLEWNVSIRHEDDLKAIKSIIGDAEYSEMLHDNNGNEYELQLTIKRVAIKKAVAA